MTPALSPNTQAILLLTAPLLAGRQGASPDLLSPGEYKRLARHLRDIRHQPADLVSPDAAEILHACRPVIDEDRLQRLLARGFLLSQVIERWQARAIWVVSRADAEYPRRLKLRLREDTPAVLYGCGDMTLLETGGLAVVGSRNVDDVLIDYTMSIGQLAARADRTLVSGGAKGIDQAAMRGALDAGGRVCGVLADSLEKTILNRAHRNVLLDGQLVLISPCDPNAGFNVGNAMQRNKLIYALADAALVVSSDLKKGGTWTGAVEQLDRFRFVPVFVRSTGEPSDGLDALKGRGALPWPNPRDIASFENVFQMSTPSAPTPPRDGPSLFDAPPAADTPATPPDASEAAAVARIGGGSAGPGDVDPETQPPAMRPAESPPAFPNAERPGEGATQEPQSGAPPAEMLFSVVRSLLRQHLIVVMTDAQVASVLDVSNAQAKAWLQRLVEEGVLEKTKKPIGYIIKQERLF